MAKARIKVELNIDDNDRQIVTTGEVWVQEENGQEVTTPVHVDHFVPSPSSMTGHITGEDLTNQVQDLIKVMSIDRHLSIKDGKISSTHDPSERLGEEKKKRVNVLFICTSNKDRSPALEKYFKELYPHNAYRSAGINRYFCGQKKTHYLTEADLEWADLIVYAEKIHHEVRVRDFKEREDVSVILMCGEYKQGCVGDDYLTKAHNVLMNDLMGSNGEN